MTENTLPKFRSLSAEEGSLDLPFIHNQLKDRYDLQLSTGLALNAGFGWDMEVLTGEGKLGRFYLYDEGAGPILNYDDPAGVLAMDHWHPGDTQEALQYVVAFLEGNLPPK